MTWIKLENGEIFYTPDSIHRVMDAKKPFAAFRDNHKKVYLNPQAICYCWEDES